MNKIINTFTWGMIVMFFVVLFYLAIDVNNELNHSSDNITNRRHKIKSLLKKHIVCGNDTLQIVSYNDSHYTLSNNDSISIHDVIYTDIEEFKIKLDSIETYDRGKPYIRPQLKYKILTYE